MKKIFALLFILITSQTNAQDFNKTRALQLIKNNAKVFKINFLDEDFPLITNAYTDVQTGLMFIYFQQQYKGIKVFNQIQSATFRNDILQYKSGNFIENIANKVPSSSPQIAAIAAIKNAAKDLQLSFTDIPIELDNQFAIAHKITYNPSNISRRNIKTELVWKVDYKDNSIHLAWAVSIAPIGTPDNWNVMVDAINGMVIDKSNATIHEKNPNTVKNNFSSNNIKVASKSVIKLNKKISPIPPPPTTIAANYKVVTFPNENPFTAGVSVDNNPWLKAGAGNNAITNGWHFDGTTNYDITRGNNVFAYDDSLNQDTPGRWATSTTALPNLNFNFTPDFNKQPTTTANRFFATTNLFYWNNLMHDVSYQYGFNEAAGNFQADNLGRGGFGNDYVVAEAQDGGGTDNANFSALPDGDTARMQMYLFSSASNFKVLSPSGIAGSYTSQEGAFSVNNLLANVGPKTGQIVLYNDNAAGTSHNACGTAANILTGKIALIQYSLQTGCTFRQRVKNAQNAGAIAVVVVYSSNNVITMSGSDNTITIPAVMIGLDDGNKIISQIAFGNTVTATLLDGLKFDGDIDNGVVCHEYTHGISLRLTGGAANTSCLDNAEQGGEGWSDYVALMMTTNWQTATVNDGSVSRQMGVYAFAQTPTGTGIRTYPYTTDMLVNSHTYSNMAINGEAHYIGEIWCAAIWDMTWAIIQQENSINPNLYNAIGTGGNVIAMNLVMLGLKLQPCMPGFLDSRDAILAADDILYNGRHKCTIWSAFARRGMGYSAKQGSSNSTSDQVAAFDVPMTVKLSKSDAYKVLQTTLSTGLNVNASCQCKSPTSHYKIKAIIPAGFSYVNSAGGVSNADSVIFANINFIKAFQKDSFLLNIKATAAGCALDTIIYDNRDNKTLGGFVSNAISGTNDWIPTTQYAYSPTHSWQATDLQVQTELTLTSSSFTPTNLSLLSFWHQYDLEGGYDGGVVETSINNGTSWQDVGVNALQNGYNTIMASSSPLVGQQTFSGTTTSFQNSIINISKLSGKNTKLRFRVATDLGNGSNTDQTGWVVDDITVTNGCGANVKFYIFDSVNNLLDSISTPIFIIPKVLPVKFSQFSAKAINNNSLLQWIVAEQVNVKKYIIERSVDANNWNEIGELTAQSNNNFDYLFYDKKPFDGVNYYRIKAMDFSGSTIHSSIQKVNFKDVTKNQILIIPNPSKTSSKIYLPKNFAAIQIKIFDVQGRLVLNQLANNSNDSYINLNTSSFADGTYVINILNRAGEVLTEKLIITK